MYEDGDLELWFALSAFADNAGLYEQMVRSSGHGWTDFSRAFGRDFLKHDGVREPDDGPPADPTGRPDPDTLSLFD